MKPFADLVRFIRAFRHQESAQRDFLRSVYNAPSRLPADYERPAYLRRARRIAIG